MPLIDIFTIGLVVQAFLIVLLIRHIDKKRNGISGDFIYLRNKFNNSSSP